MQLEELAGRAVAAATARHKQAELATKAHSAQQRVQMGATEVQARAQRAAAVAVQHQQGLILVFKPEVRAVLAQPIQ